MTITSAIGRMGRPAPEPYDGMVPVWTADLVLAEARWAALSPASDGFDDPDPAGLVEEGFDTFEPRVLLLDWLDEAAAEAGRIGVLSESEIKSWHGRFARDRQERTPSSATSRRYVRNVAVAIASILEDAGSAWSAPPIDRPRIQDQVAAVPIAAPQTGAQRQRAYRARRRARLGSIPSLGSRREALLRATPADSPLVAQAKSQAASAIREGGRIDAARALENLYTAGNDQEDPDAALVARWAAELFPAGSIESYFMYNSAWGVVIRHPALAVGRQPVWANLAATEAYAALPEETRREDSLTRIRHLERYAQAITGLETATGVRPNHGQWERAARDIAGFSEEIANRNLADVEFGWQAVVLNRQMELALTAERYRMRSPGVPTLSQAQDLASALLREAEGLLPVLRQVQVQVHLARVALAQHRLPEMFEMVAATLPLAGPYPGQLGHLDAIVKQVGVRLDDLSSGGGRHIG